MEHSIIDIAKKVVEQTCKGANLMVAKAFYVSIKGYSITVSNDVFANAIKHDFKSKNLLHDGAI